MAALIVLPVAWCALRLLRALRSRWVYSFLKEYASSSRLTRLTAALMLVTAAIHLALIPAHLREEPGTALLFAANAALFTVFAFLAFVVRWWRPWAGVLLVATILAYLRNVRLGLEDVDQVGLIS